MISKETLWKEFFVIEDVNDIRFDVFPFDWSVALNPINKNPLTYPLDVSVLKV